MTINRNLIAGSWVESTDVIRNINPSNTDDVVGEYAAATAEQVEQVRVVLADDLDEQVEAAGGRHDVVDLHSRAGEVRDGRAGAELSVVRVTDHHQGALEGLDQLVAVEWAHRAMLPRSAGTAR